MVKRWFTLPLLRSWKIHEFLDAFAGNLPFRLGFAGFFSISFGDGQLPSEKLPEEPYS